MGNQPTYQDENQDHEKRPDEKRPDEKRPDEKRPDEEGPNLVAEKVQLNQAIEELEKEVAKPNPDPKLKDIYEVIKCLLPIKTLTNQGKTESRINEEKNGRELFDKVIQEVTKGNEDNGTVGWLIDKKLLELNQPDKQGILPLEKAVSGWIDWPYSTIPLGLANITQTLLDKGATLPPAPSAKLLENLIENHFIKDTYKPHHTTILEFLKKQGAQLPPDQASRLLEKFIEKQLTQTEDLPIQVLSDMVNFLQNQGGAIPAANALVLLEKFIQRKRKTDSYSPQEKQEEEKNWKGCILGLLEQHSIGAISPAKATALLQQAIDKAQGPKLYKFLIQQGADPNNIQVKKDYTSEKVPLLHYIADNSSKEGFQEVFQELINNPITNTNIAGENNFTVAMKEAYQGGNTALVDKLLQRNDLDINTIKSDYMGLRDYTLLDTVVQNCMVIPTGHENQQKRIVEANKRWLTTLNKMKTHPNFKITSENLQEAQENYKSCQSGAKANYSSYKKEALDIALEALSIVKDGPK